MGHRHALRYRRRGFVSDSGPFAAPSAPVPVPGSVFGAPATPPSGGFTAPDPPAPGQPSAGGTHAKRTSYAALGASTISGASIDGSGSSPVAGSPVVWPTTGTATPPLPGSGPAAGAAVTVSGPRTVQPRTETLVTLKLP